MTKRLIFELSMPSNRAWNNRWSGDDKRYTLAKNVTEKQAKRMLNHYSYAFGDGWCAAVTVRPAIYREKVTGKFCGYDWMVSEIICYNEIRGNKNA